MKFLFVGDFHLRGTSPRNRKDDIVAAAKAKLEEIFQLAESNRVEAILTPGDNWDRPEVATAVLLEFADLLAESPVNIYTTWGSHDVYGYNPETLKRTSLALLERLVPQVIVRDGTLPRIEYELFEKDGCIVQVTFQPHTRVMDDPMNQDYGYSPSWVDPNRVKIHVVHGMLLDHIPPFERFTLVQSVRTKADIVLAGHYHEGFGVYKRADGKVFCNPGSLLRMSASTGEIERPVQVALIDVRGPGDYSVDLIPLQSAKPAEEVLDRSGIEAEQARAYAMEGFAALIQDRAGNRVVIDIDTIITTIAEQENIAPEVVKEALRKIQDSRIGG